MGVTEPNPHKGIKFGWVEVDYFMTEKIKMALNAWAEKVLKDQAKWRSEEHTSELQSR